MKTLKKYEKFSNQVNENLLQNFTNYISVVFDLFFKKFKEKASAYYAIYLSKKNELPRDNNGRLKVMVKVPSDWYNDPVFDEIDKTLTEDNIEIPDDIKGGQEFSMNKSEAVVDTSSKNIDNIDVKELKDTIEDEYFNLLDSEHTLFDEKGVRILGTLFIWGAPGIGKTQITTQLAKELGIQIQVWTLATLDPTDLKGIPFVKKITNLLFPKRTIHAIPSVLPKSNWNGKNNKGGILFLDEFNRGSSYVHNAALSLINNGKIDDYKLPSRWLIVAAGNKLSDLANMAGSEMSAEMQNRFYHVNLVPTVKDFKGFAKDKENTNPDILEFLSFNTSYLHKMEDDPNILADYPSYATPRSWIAASREHYQATGKNWDNKLPYDTIKRIYSAHVGREAASQFVNFIEFKDKYNESDIIDVYQNGAKAKRGLPRNDKGRLILNLAYAAILAITSYVANQKRTITPKELSNLYDYALRTEDMELAEMFLNRIRHYYSYSKEPGKYPELSNIRNEKIKLWHKKVKDAESELKGLDV